MSTLRLFEKPEETPPGLDAIRAWLRKPRPRLRGLWIWVRWVLSGIPAAYQYLKKNWPAIRARIHRVAVQGEKVARGAVKVGYAAREVGAGIVTSTRALRGSDGKVSGAAARAREFGRGMRDLGGRLTEGGRGFAQALTSFHTLIGSGPGDGGRGLGLLDPPEEPEREPPEPERGFVPRPPKPKTSRGVVRDGASAGTAQRAASAKHSASPVGRPQPEPGSSDPATDAARQARFEGLPTMFIPMADVGDRPDPEALSALILEICRHREWTTPAQLARWFDMHRRSFSHRYIRPLVKARLLERRYPDRPNTPKQAYRTRRPESSEPAA